jgi:hypothetical protein
MKKVTFGVVLGMAGVWSLAAASVADAGWIWRRPQYCYPSYQYRPTYQSPQVSGSTAPSTASSGTTQRFSFEPNGDVIPTVPSTPAPTPTFERSGSSSSSSSSNSKVGDIERRRQRPGQGFRP